jgi:hypothetical protein
MFNSRTVGMHLFRGVLGFGFVAIALLYSSKLGWWILAPIVGALVSFRGCPTCWTMGLMETLLNRKTGAFCADESCAGKR